MWSKLGSTGDDEMIMHLQAGIWLARKRGGNNGGTRMAIMEPEWQSNGPPEPGLVLFVLVYMPSIYLSMRSHSVLPVDRRYRMWPWRASAPSTTRAAAAD